MFGVFLDTMLQAACSTAFFAYLRCGEFTINNAKQDNILRTEDMVMDTEETAFTLILRRSKFEEEYKSVYFNLVILTVCPVQCMKKYLMFRRSWFNRNVSLLFVDESGNPLSRHLFISKLKQILKSLDFADEKFQGLSLRIGAATSAAAGQVEDHLIKTLGRWSSNCYTRYIRSDDQTLSRAQQAMCCL